MAANCEVDTELLIGAVQKERCIWDSSDERYKNRDQKSAAYERIAAMLITDFNNLPEGKKRDAVNLVQRRWKTARDAYVRDKAKLRNTKSGSAAKKFKTYVYFENLKFLDGILDLNMTETNYDNNDDTLTGTAGEDSEDHSESEDAVSALPTAEIVSKVNERNFQSKKRRHNDDIDQKLISLLHDAKNEKDDDDRAFVTSLLPNVKSFDEGQKLQFRAEVSRIMLEINKFLHIDLGNPANTSSELVFFTWHPVLLSIGWVLLMGEGILIFNPHNILVVNLSYSTKVQLHWIIQGLGTTACVIGFVIIYVHKNLHDKPHFHSWHGIFGLIFVLMLTTVILTGLLALYSFSLRNYISSLNTKFAHRVFGVVSYMIGGVTVLLNKYYGLLHKINPRLIMADSVQTNASTPTRNPNLAKWDILFDKKIVEWISFKPQLGLYVYPCYACRHMFASKNSFLDHVNRRALVLRYKCAVCAKELMFYNPCSFLLHTRQHFTLLGGQIDLENLRISILPFGLGGFLPDPNVPLLYDVDEDEAGEISVLNSRFYSPMQETMGRPIISLIPNEVLFLFMVEPNGSLSSLVLKQISSTIPKCKFVAMDNNRLNPIPSGLDIYGRELSDSTNNNNNNNNESVIEIKQEPEEADENRTQYACPIITKIETVREKDHDQASFPSCPECELIIHDKSMAEHFLDTNKPFREHLKCNVCKYIAPTNCSFAAHERIHKNEPPFVCPECGKDFANGDLLKSHLEEICFHLTKQVRLKCPGKKCGKVFAQILTFTTHFAMHMRRLNKCAHCQEVFQTDAEYFQHRMKHNVKSLPSPIFDCAVCKETFSEKASSDHIYDHATDKKQSVYVYICRHCRSYFRSTTTYATHLLRCSKLAARVQLQNIVKGNPPLEKTKKNQVLYILDTCHACKTQIKAQVPKIDNMPENCPNCYRPLKNKNENVLFTTNNDTGVKCVLCQDTLDPLELDNHFNSDNCKYFKPLIPLQHVEVKSPGSETSPRLDSNCKKKRRKPWTISHSSKQKRLSVSFEPEPINLEAIEPTPFDGTYHCKSCSFSSSARNEFHQHIVQHRNISTAYQCMECGECFVVKPSLEKHLVYYHQISDIDSYFDENECFDKQAVKELEDVMHLAPGESKDVAQNQCRVCLLYFDDENELSKHFRTHGMAFILKKSK
ncbi:hypothetical protein RN001_004335 [Aquatica leii]|uniref:Uncharacterized protein n=1 Tax=Aquatica leii TaxID=1421715 RepID=A0AAN7PI78_9COLE|nr:hypothetical protein RN001_004335 [Aquatica leii]